MTPKLRCIEMDRDDVAWEKSDEAADSWERSLHKEEVYRGIAKIILAHRPGEAVELHRPIRGGYNIFYRLEYKDGSSAAMRIPREGIVKFPEEKVRYEVATMRYIAANTSIPVPKVYYMGTAAENLAGLGPFIIMDYLEFEMTMSEALKDPTLEPDEYHVLDPNVSNDKLEFLYRQMANIVLQLSTLVFPRIGSLTQDEDGQFAISGRPLIQNMNSILEFTGCPPTLLPSQTYSSSKEWYSALADMHLMQLTFQRNDAVSDDEDARDTYVARQLFRRLASQGRLTLGFDVGVSEKHDNESSAFRLFSEDLRPSNVLVDKDLRVVGVIDWEFAYAAPAQFSFDPPWWLLLKTPEDWPGGFKAWAEAYEPRLNTFLHVLEDEERKMWAGAETRCGTADTSSVESGESLASCMRRSWESKTWLVNYAARNSWAFDFIFWRYLDTRYFGPNENGDFHARLSLLSQEEIDAMEPFVRTKMEEAQERTLVQWDHESAVTRLAGVKV